MEKEIKRNSAADLIWPNKEIPFVPGDYYNADRRTSLDEPVASRPIPRQEPFGPLSQSDKLENQPSKQPPEPRGNIEE